MSKRIMNFKNFNIKRIRSFYLINFAVFTGIAVVLYMLHFSDYEPVLTKYYDIAVSVGATIFTVGIGLTYGSLREIKKIIKKSDDTNKNFHLFITDNITFLFISLFFNLLILGFSSITLSLIVITSLLSYNILHLIFFYPGDKRLENIFNTGADEIKQKSMSKEKLVETYKKIINFKI